jgi:hypothetical protein
MTPCRSASILQAPSKQAWKTNKQASQQAVALMMMMLSLQQALMAEMVLLVDREDKFVGVESKKNSMRAPALPPAF